MVQVKNIKTVTLFDVFIFVYYFFLSTGGKNTISKMAYLK